MKKALKDLLERQESGVKEDLKDNQVNQVKEGNQELQVQLDHLDHKVHKVKEDKLESVVKLDLKVDLDLLVCYLSKIVFVYLCIIPY